MPSAAYLEEKLRRERGEVRETDPVSAKYISQWMPDHPLGFVTDNHGLAQQEYLDIMRKRAEKMGSSYSLGEEKAAILFGS